MKRRLQSYAEEWGQQLWTIRKMILLLACRYLAGVLIRILKEKTSALMQIDTTTFLPLILCFLPLAQKGFTARKKGIYFRL